MTESLRAEHPPYRVAGLTKGPALEEVRALLEIWTPGQNARDLLADVQANGSLGKATAESTRGILANIFKPRFLVPDDRPARHLKYFLHCEGDPRAFREIVLLHHARSERVFYDFIVERFWPAAAQGELFIRVADVLLFLDELVQQHKITRPLSSSTRLRAAHGLLQSLVDYGLLLKGRAERREIVSFRASDTAVAYLAHDLHFAGLPDAEVIADPDWKLFGLDQSHRLDRLDALSPAAGILLQRAGSVVRISWTHPSMEALLHAVVG
jgi:hypothetical protein